MEIFALILSTLSLGFIIGCIVGYRLLLNEHKKSIVRIKKADTERFREAMKHTRIVPMEQPKIEVFLLPLEDGSDLDFGGKW